jgi:hypothetical protein
MKLQSVMTQIMIPDPIDTEFVIREAQRLLDAGYTTEDAVAYLKNLEEVNPTLPENVALRRMKKISSKYRA